MRQIDRTPEPGDVFVQIHGDYTWLGIVKKVSPRYSDGAMFFEGAYFGTNNENETMSFHATGTYKVTSREIVVIPRALIKQMLKEKNAELDAAAAKKATNNLVAVAGANDAAIAARAAAMSIAAAAAAAADSAYASAAAVNAATVAEAAGADRPSQVEAGEVGPGRSEPAAPLAVEAGASGEMSAVREAAGVRIDNLFG